MPGTFTDVIELLIPELQRRGIFWNDYAVPGGTYRENLTETKGQREPCEDHPAAKMIWRAPEGGDAKVEGNRKGGGGWYGEEVGEGQERLDNVSLQIG